MTREEVQRLLGLVAASFPTFKPEDKTATVDAWLFNLEEYNLVEVLTAFKTYSATSGSKYAPSVAELIAMVHKPKELTELDSVKAWDMVRKAIKNGNYGAKEEFEKLPDDVKEAVGSPGQIRNWAMMESATIDSVVASNFKKAFDAQKKRRNELQKMPDIVKQAINKSIERKENGLKIGLNNPT